MLSYVWLNRNTCSIKVYVDKKGIWSLCILSCIIAPICIIIWSHTRCHVWKCWLRITRSDVNFWQLTIFFVAEHVGAVCCIKRYMNQFYYTKITTTTRGSLWLHKKRHGLNLTKRWRNSKSTRRRRSSESTRWSSKCRWNSKRTRRKNSKITNRFISRRLCDRHWWWCRHVCCRHVCWLWVNCIE